MTLDVAIDHAKEVARTCDDPQCAADHLQLAEWLRQARGAEKGARWLTGKIREIETENDKLRGICGSMLKFMLPSDRRYSLKEQMAIIDNFAEMCGELGIEVSE